MRSKCQNASSDHFDLLPFVAILMGTLGCLLFITLSVVSLSLTPAKAGPDRTAQNKKPVLIEWAKPVSTIIENGRRVAVNWSPSAWEALETRASLKSASPEIPTEMKRLLNEIGSQPARRYILFAVRPSGFKAFSAMADLCKQRHIDIGFYPIGENDAVKGIPRSMEVIK